MEFKFRDLVRGASNDDFGEIERRSRAALIEAQTAGKHLCVVLDERDVRIAPAKAGVLDVRVSMTPIRYAHRAVIRTTDGSEYVLKEYPLC